MARKMQKMMALVLAMSLTVGQVVIPALADDSEGTIQIPGENLTVTTDGNTITTTGSVTMADGTTITVTERVTTDPATGSTTSAASTTQENSDTGASSSNSIVTTTTAENTGENGSKTTTDIQSAWNSTNTTGNTTTTTAGTQTSHHESTSDSENRPLQESASLSGQESTTTTTTTTSSSTSVQESSDKIVENGEYTETGRTETNPQEIAASATEEKIVGSADISGLEAPGATIGVTPGSTSTETVALTPEQIQKILDSNKTLLNIPKAADHENATETKNGFTYTTTNSEGKKVVVEITYQYGTGTLANTIIGYTKTTYTTERETEEESSKTTETNTITIGQPLDGNNRNYQMPQRAAEGTVTNEDGSKTVTVVEDQKNEADELIGYKTVRTTTSADGKNTVVDTITEYRTEINTSSNTTFTLPTRPSGGTVNHADGSTTVTTVAEILENGQVVGYKTTRVTTSADGQYTYTESESIYGTTTTVESQTTTAIRNEETASETTTTKTITTETLIFYDAEGYQLIWDANGNQWVYRATMSTVRGDGKVSQSVLEPVYVKDLSKGGKDLETRSDSTASKSADTRPEGYDYIYRGVRSLGSQYRVEANNSGMYKAHLFQLEKLNEDGGTETFFAYCIDMGTSAESNYYYKIENLENASYITANQKQHIKAIAMNGYWGTEPGDDTNAPNLGSLAAMKKKLVDEGILTQDEANQLTDGEALTATQAAFWKYGNSSTTLQVNDSQSSGHKHEGDSWSTDSAAGARINAVYQWLIDLTATGESDEPTQIIDKSNFATSATVHVKNAVTDEETTQKKYNTDISFTMNVKKSSLTGNLKVVITQNGKTIKTVTIATEDSNLLGQLLADENITDTETGSRITIPDVELAEGIQFTITLDGTQNLKTGAYLYTSEVVDNKSSQSFVTLTEGVNAVNLSVDLTLSVTEPDVKVQDPGQGKQARVTTTQVLEKVDSSRSFASYEDTYEQTTTTSHTKRSWVANLLRSWDYEKPPEEENPKVYDKDIPLAEAPKTGDHTWLWTVVCLSSLAGAMLLHRKKEQA